MPLPLQLLPPVSSLLHLSPPFLRTRQRPEARLPSVAQALPPPPPDSRPVALTGPYSGANPVTDMHVVHNPEHFEPQLQRGGSREAEQKNEGSRKGSASPNSGSSARTFGKGDSASEPALPPTTGAGDGSGESL